MTVIEAKPRIADSQESFVITKLWRRSMRRFKTISIISFLVLCFFGVSALHAASITKNGDVPATITFPKGTKAVIGHLEGLKIGDKTAKADLKVTNPEDKASRKIVGAIEKITWAGGVSDPLNVVVWVSAANKKMAAAFTKSTSKEIPITFSFKISEVDKSTNKYFRSFHTDSATLYGLIKRTDGKLDLSVSDKYHTGVASPKVYKIIFRSAPADRQQQIHISISEKNKFVKPWGVGAR